MSAAFSDKPAVPRGDLNRIAACLEELRDSYRQSPALIDRYDEEDPEKYRFYNIGAIQALNVRHSDHLGRVFEKDIAPALGVDGHTASFDTIIEVMTALGWESPEKISEMIDLCELLASPQRPSVLKIAKYEGRYLPSMPEDMLHGVRVNTITPSATDVLEFFDACLEFWRACPDALIQPVALR
ncbi:hypothetical protein [Novosphingobium terrae]|uniref:hypothetical protein n=1 Tax=Novosphingobium terrae TaxID=2726189 RepID=UPI00197F299D|nr:hypothetical protein [Novosphingobium terrae]